MPLGRRRLPYSCGDRSRVGRMDSARITHLDPVHDNRRGLQAEEDLAQKKGHPNGCTTSPMASADRMALTRLLREEQVSTRPQYRPGMASIVQLSFQSWCRKHNGFKALPEVPVP